jgi:hypothetical protein
MTEELFLLYTSIIQHSPPIDSMVPGKLWQPVNPPRGTQMRFFILRDQQLHCSWKSNMFRKWNNVPWNFKIYIHIILISKMVCGLTKWFEGVVPWLLQRYPIQSRLLEEYKTLCCYTYDCCCYSSSISATDSDFSTFSNSSQISLFLYYVC